MSESLWRYAFLLSLAMLLPIILHMLFFRLGMRCLIARKMVRVNFAKKVIPTAGGLLLLGNLSVTFLVIAFFSTYLSVFAYPLKEGLLFLTGSIAVALWGWQDDRSSDRSSKGFRGHFAALLNEERMTSGLLKALGIGSTSFILSLALSDGVLEMIFDTGILALSCNFLNLFDLRPGRAIKVFWLLGILLFLTTPILSVVPWVMALPIVFTTLLYFVHDARGHIMLGDAGANYLGFLLGYASVMSLSLEVKFVVLLLLILITWLAEYVSFSAYIRSVKWLHRADQWGSPIRRPSRGS